MKKHLNDQLYEIIAASIRDRRLPEGTLLLEGHLAELFHVSRSPVRQALVRLCEERLICTFDGRGYLVGAAPAEVIRDKFDMTVFGTVSKTSRPKKTESWQRVYNDIERELLHHSLFGSHRINELELSRYYNISRTVSNQVLTRLHLLGLVEKDERSRWQLLEWDERRLEELYEVRRRLEPYVLMRAAEFIPAEEVQLFIERLQQFDRLVIAGQAKSHCVAWTVSDLLEDIAVVDLELAEKVYLLEDCTSPVVVPGVVDHTEAADAAFERFAKVGMHLIKSTEPIKS